MSPGQEMSQAPGGWLRTGHGAHSSAVTQPRPAVPFRAQAAPRNPGVPDPVCPDSWGGRCRGPNARFRDQPSNFPALRVS